MHELQGIVEDVSLRHTRLRTLDGEVIHIHNSQIPPSGAAGRQGCSSRSSSPTVSAGSRWSSPSCRSCPRARRPSSGDPGSTASTRLGETLVRISARATVAPGREWLVDGFFADLLREQAGAGVIAHGPVTLSVDESAAELLAGERRDAAVERMVAVGL